MKKTLIKDKTIHFQEKTPNGMVSKSFDCPKEHVNMHLTAMKKMCFNTRVETKKG